MAAPTTSQPDPKSYIATLCQANGKNSEELARTARCIHKDVGSFIDKSCFLWELLQNADDQVNKGLAEVSITLLGPELAFSHNGKPFNHKDVKGLCDYANADNNGKGVDPDKTGYKDVGFKSVFSVAHRVDVFSREWQFRFDEKDPKWKREPHENPYPWQIAPLWIEDHEISKSCKHLIQSRRTVFICHLRNPKEMETHLQQFAQQPEQLLFLKRIHKLSIAINGKQFEMSFENNVLRATGMPSSQWKKIDEMLPMPKELIAELATDSYNWPRRLKGKQEVQLSFCYKQDETGWTEASHCRLYCTLPTGVKAGLPFMVDAPFSLNSSRESLLVNSLNLFLVEKIAHSNFMHVRNLLATEPTAIRLLAPSQMSEINRELADRFKTCMQGLVDNQPILPSYSGKKLLRVSQCQVDPTGFLRLLDEIKLNCEGYEHMVHPSISFEDILKRFKKVPKITLEEVLQMLPTVMKNNLDVRVCLCLLTFVAKQFSNKSYSVAQLNLLCDQPFVLNSQKKLCKLNELYLPMEGHRLPSNLLVNVIHADLLNPEIQSWLEEIGMKSLTANSLLEIYVKNKTHRSLENFQNNIEILRIFYHFIQQKKLSEQSVKRLSGILLFNKKKKPIHSYYLFLPGSYGAQTTLENDPPLNEILLHEDYCEPQDEKVHWKKLLVALGVNDKIEMGDTKKITVEQIKKIPFAWVDNYLSYVFRADNPKRPAKTLSRTAHDDDDLSPFFWFPYMQWVVESPTLEGIFWKQLAENQTRILQYFQRETYHASHAQTLEQPITYLQYLFASQPVVRNTEGKFQKAPQVYAPSMRAITGGVFPTANLPVELNPEMERFLGFKTHLDVSACAHFLEELQQNYKHTSYRFVVHQILLNLRKKDAAVLKAIRGWKFQAANGEWRSLATLKFWGVPQVPVPATHEWFKSVFADDREQEEFCAALEINAHKELLNDDLFASAQSSDDLRQFLIQKVLRIAYFWSKERKFDSKPHEVISFLLKKLQEVKFLLKDAEDEEISLPPQFIDQKLLYFADWKDNIRLLVEPLGKLFGMGSKGELDALAQALTRDTPVRSAANPHFPLFEEAYQKTLNSIANDPEPLSVPPSPPKGKIPPKGPPSEPPGTPPQPAKPKEGPKQKNPWSPQTDAKGGNTTPSKDLPSLPEGWKPSVPARGDHRKGKSTKEQRQESSGMSDLDKKRIGNWAEEKVLDHLLSKYRKKYSDAEEKNETAGVYTLASKIHNRFYRIIWNNDPQKRPEEEKDNEKWDSGNQFDLQVIRIGPSKKNPLKTEHVRKYEVKGTTGSLIRFYLSSLEFQTLLSDSFYRLVIVTDVGTDDAAVTPIKDLLQTLKERKLLPFETSAFRQAVAP